MLSLSARFTIFLYVLKKYNWKKSYGFKTHPFPSQYVLKKEKRKIQFKWALRNYWLRHEASVRAFMGFMVIPDLW